VLPSGVMSIVTIEALIASLAKPGILLSHRFIAEGDEHALMAREAPFFERAVVSVRRQSGAARLVARSLLENLDHFGFAITKEPSGAAVWPSGIVGSMAHDDTIAIAAVARVTDYSCLGLDIEPAEELPAGLVELVSTPAERRRYDSRFLAQRHLFVAKEAVFKAVHPADGIFLDHHHIDIDLQGGVGSTSYGRIVKVEVAAGAGHVIALAYQR